MSRSIGTLLLCLLALGLAGGCGGDRPLNLLLVTLDTTRADFLGCYGKGEATTPNLDRLAAEGSLFLQCRSAAPVTLPSHSTIMTGTYPVVHGVRDNGLFRLPDESLTLAEILQGHGYATAGVIGAFPITREFGIAQGFDFFDDFITGHQLPLLAGPGDDLGRSFFDERPGSEVNDAVLPWIREHLQRPFFTWIHYWDPHHPHIPPPPYDQLYQHDLYQGEIAYADQCLGTILRELEAGGVADRTVVVVVGDHGEGLGEHNEDTHSLLAYDSTLRVPLIIRAPGLPAGRRIAQMVGTVDIVPTVLDLLGHEIPSVVQGRSLKPLMNGSDEGTGPARAYYAEALSPRLAWGCGELRVLYDRGLKYIHGPRAELFDLDRDPRELVDLVAERPDDAARLEEELARRLSEWSSEMAVEAVHEVDAETAQRLAALGYLTGSGDSASAVREELTREGIPPQDRVTLNNLVSQLRTLISAGSFLRAREIARDLVERAPENDFYRSMLAYAHLRLGHIDRAADVVDDVLDSAAVSDRDLGVYLIVSQELFAAGERERGLAMARRINQASESAHGCYLVAEMMAVLDDEPAYEEWLERSLRLDPTFTPTRLSRAIQLAGQGRADEADALFGGLVADYPLTPRYHFNYGVFLLDSGRDELALARFVRAGQLDPRYWQARIAEIATLTSLGRDDQAAREVADLERRCRSPQVLARARALIGDPT